MKSLSFLMFMSMFAWSQAQVSPGIYFASDDDITYELKLTEDYFVLNTYKAEPAEFLQTIGGFYEIADEFLKVKLEFNSDYEEDSVTMVEIPFQEEGGILIFRMEDRLVFNLSEDKDQALDGVWLFATRGPDEGQERRDDKNARKTLKLLMDGRFQWVAYNTETMKFYGTGGGDFTSQDGNYLESIHFFSRDNSRVGAELPFNYELKGDDWHHTGKNSKGEDMYEIWARR